MKLLLNEIMVFQDDFYIFSNRLNVTLTFDPNQFLHSKWNTENKERIPETKFYSKIFVKLFLIHNSFQKLFRMCMYSRHFILKSVYWALNDQMIYCFFYFSALATRNPFEKHAFATT